MQIIRSESSSTGRKEITKRVIGFSLLILGLLLLLILLGACFFLIPLFGLLYAAGIGDIFGFSVEAYAQFHSVVIVLSVAYMLIFWFIKRAWRLARGKTWSVVVKEKHKFMFPVLKPLIFYFIYIVCFCIYLFMRLNE